MLLVDNASTDGSAELAEAGGARVRRNPRNEGYGRANNAGVRDVDTAFVLICNPDVTLAPGAMAALLFAAKRYPDAGLYAPRLVEPDGRVFFQARSLLAPISAREPGAPDGARGRCRWLFVSGRPSVASPMFRLRGGGGRGLIELGPLPFRHVGDGRVLAELQRADVGDDRPAVARRNHRPYGGIAPNPLVMTSKKCPVVAVRSVSVWNDGGRR